MADFEHVKNFIYVVHKPKKAKICFGSAQERDKTRIASRLGISQTFESNPNLYPGKYGVIQSKQKGVSIRGTVLGGRTADRKFSLQETDGPAPTNYNPQHKPQQFISFGKLERFPRIPKQTIVGPGYYNLSNDKKTIACRYSFGGKRIIIPPITMKCGPINTDQCEKCKNKPVGDYWTLHQNNNETVNYNLCRPCFEDERKRPQMFSKTQLSNFKRCGPVRVFIFPKECLHLTTDDPRGPGGVSRVSGGRDDPRAFSNKRRWIPPSSLRRDALWQENGNDVIFRKVQGILNKLTPEKFQKLSDDILSIGLTSNEILKGLILLIFKKALDEPKYSSMYARLCKRLADEAPNFEPPDQPQTFKNLLINNCRTEFEKRIEQSEQNDGQVQGDDEDRVNSAKRKMLGNIKFIGELGKLEIVSDSILHRCIQALFQNIYRLKTRDVSEDVECLAQIMKTCGRIMDTDKGKYLMDQYFSRMEQLIDTPEFQLRIRFMLKDVIELRRDGWVPRKANCTEGPMPINQIQVDEKIRAGFPSGGLVRPTPNAGLDGLFRNPLKTRAGLDDVLGFSSPFLPHHDNFSKGFVGNSNGFSSGNPYRSNRGNSSSVYFGGRHGNNNFNNNNKQNNQAHFNNNSSAKDVPPRFKKNLLPPGGAGLIEDISLRPAAFKPPQAKPSQPITGVRGGGLMLSEPLLPSPQIQMAKEAPILIKQASADKGKASKRDKGPSKEEVLAKLGAILEKKFTKDELLECAQEIKDIKFPERQQNCVINHILYLNLNNNAEEERKLAVQLISELKKISALNGDKILEALRELVATMAEKEPAIVTAYIKDCIILELVSLAAVAEMTEGGEHFPLFLMILQALLDAEGNQSLLQRFNESKVNLMNQVTEADRTKEKLAEILGERDLTFLNPLSSIQSSLWKHLSVDPNPTSFYKWVKDNMDAEHYTNPEFISALATVIIKYVVQESSGELLETSASGDKQQLQDKEKALLEKYKNFLCLFLQERPDLQMIAVYALQVFCYSLQFPKGMLRRWFINLYDLEIVEEEAFMKWKEDLNDAYPGKGQALFQVNPWLEWLATAEEEEDDDEVED